MKPGTRLLPASILAGPTEVEVLWRRVATLEQQKQAIEDRLEDLVRAARECFYSVNYANSNEWKSNPDYLGEFKRQMIRNDEIPNMKL